MADYTQISDEETQRLCDLANAGDVNARNKALLAHKGLLHFFAATYSGNGFLDFDDLVQEGVFGLDHALTGYDSSQGSFSTYARYFIRRYMQRAIYVESRRGIALDEKKAYNLGHKATGNATSDSARFVAGRLSRKVDETYHQIRESRASFPPADARLESEEDIQEILQTVDQKIDPTDACFFRAYFGIGEPARTYPAIAKEHGVTKQRVEQRVVSARKELRRRVSA